MNKSLGVVEVVEAVNIWKSAESFARGKNCSSLRAWLRVNV